LLAEHYVALLAQRAPRSTRDRWLRDARPRGLRVLTLSLPLGIADRDEFQRARPGGLTGRRRVATEFTALLTSTAAARPTSGSRGRSRWHARAAACW